MDTLLSGEEYWKSDVGFYEDYIKRKKNLELLSQDNYSVVTELIQKGKITLQEVQNQKLRNIITDALGNGTNESTIAENDREEKKNML